MFSTLDKIKLPVISEVGSEEESHLAIHRTPAKRKSYRRKNRFQRYTKKELMFIIKNWERLGAKKVAKKLGRHPASLSVIVTSLRKAGIHVPQSKKVMPKQKEKSFADLVLEIKREMSK